MIENRRPSYFPNYYTNVDHACPSFTAVMVGILAAGSSEAVVTVRTGDETFAF